MRPSRSASFTMRSASWRGDGGVALGGERLGQQLERADRRLQLVADVGDEVAPHALDPVELGDVVHEDGRADERLAVEQRERAEPQHHPRRARTAAAPLSLLTPPARLGEQGR